MGARSLSPSASAPAAQVERDAPGFSGTGCRWPCSGKRSTSWSRDRDGRKRSTRRSNRPRAPRAAVGPFRIADLAGLPTFRAIAAYVYPDLSSAPPLRPSRDSIRRGHTGARAGRGFYVYLPAPRVPDRPA